MRGVRSRSCVCVAGSSVVGGKSIDRVWLVECSGGSRRHHAIRIQSHLRTHGPHQSRSGKPTTQGSDSIEAASGARLSVTVPEPPGGRPSDGLSRTDECHPEYSDPNA